MAGITAVVSTKTLTRQYAGNVTLRSVRVTVFVMEKQKVLHILTMCVFVALVMQHAKRMRRIIVLPSVTVRLYNIFPHYLTQFSERNC